MPFAEDLDVFYDADDFAIACVRLRPGEPDVPFAALLGTADQDGFGGQLTAGTTLLQYPTAAVDLRQGDLVQTPAATFRVLRNPERVVDGAESQAYLTPEPA